MNRRDTVRSRVTPSHARLEQVSRRNSRVRRETNFRKQRLASKNPYIQNAETQSVDAVPCKPLNSKLVLRLYWRLNTSRTAWRWTQSTAKSSPLSKFLVTGKNTGNFSKLGIPLQFWRFISESIQWFAAKFPANRNRECFEAYQGSFVRRMARNREFLVEKRLVAAPNAIVEPTEQHVIFCRLSAIFNMSASFPIANVDLRPHDVCV
jgi:hypothetical protein